MNARRRGKAAPFSPLIVAPDYPPQLVTAIARVVEAPILAKVDLPAFLAALLASLGLGLGEKYRMLQALPLLSQFQVDELLATFADERKEFEQLVDEEWPVLAVLCAKAWTTACMLADSLGAGYRTPEAESAALAAMVSAKYRTSAQKRWRQRALASNQGSVFVRRMYGAPPVASRPVPAARPAGSRPAGARSAPALPSDFTF